ncbi:MAG: hypothetical protein IT373_12135, partial [Polyangiaceae bacterium]|nr:hypothetical protein [Polyangiaceae bacterium]
MKSTVAMGVLFGLGLAVLGCNKPKGPNNPTAQGSASASADVGETPEPSSEGPQPAGSSDAPEISRSLGAADGVVVFWPRIIPRSTDPATTKLAKDVQDHLVELVKKALPGKAVDVRPEPERVCPRDGCVAMTVGVLLTSTEGGCVTVGLVAGPGKAESHLVPWGGAVQLKS